MHNYDFIFERKTLYNSADLGSASLISVLMTLEGLYLVWYIQSSMTPGAYSETWCSLTKQSSFGQEGELQVFHKGEWF